MERRRKGKEKETGRGKRGWGDVRNENKFEVKGEREDEEEKEEIRNTRERCGEEGEKKRKEKREKSSLSLAFNSHAIIGLNERST